MVLPLHGKVTDYGDLVHVEQWLIKGRHLQIVWHIGPDTETTAADRIVRGAPSTPTGKADVTMDLKADKKRTLRVGGWRDELNNPTTPPADFTITYTVDDTSLINLTDNGDGTCVAAAVGVLGGPATVHAEAVVDGRQVTGDMAIFVVPGDAERLELEAGEEEEVTPDE